MRVSEGRGVFIVILLIQLPLKILDLASFSYFFSSITIIVNLFLPTFKAIIFTFLPKGHPFFTIGQYILAFPHNKLRAVVDI